MKRTEQKINDEKRLLRKKILSVRNSMSIADIEKKSENIVKALVNTNEYRLCESIFTYVNANSEVITKELIGFALAEGKKVAVPVMGDNAREMFFMQTNDLSLLKKNKFGILEPALDLSKIFIPDNKTVVIVPGVVFGKDKSRIGYGGGYYDKFLAENTYLCCIGLAMDFQVLPKVVSAEYDRRLDMIITESEIII